MADQLRWGILGTGGIAHQFARGLGKSKTGQLVAVGSRNQTTADQFAQEFQIQRAHGSYEQLLDDSEVQAVYISTPHPFHAEWAIKAAEAGKHILCEKPIGINTPQTMAMIEAARQHGVFLMEAFMYRCHPQTARVVELIKQGAIGQVRIIQATFSFQAGYDLSGRLLNQDLGGGGILDVGCYCVSMARLVAGAAQGLPFAEPIELHATARLGHKSRVDEYAIASLKFPGDILAQLSTGVQLNQDNAVRIYGSEGMLLIPNAWLANVEPGESTIVLHQHGKAPETITISTDRGLYSLEADMVAECLPEQQATYPAMSWKDSLGNMQTLDWWRRAIGLQYDLEKPERQTAPLTNRPLKVNPQSKMLYGELPGVNKKISRLFMGVDNQDWIPHGAVMFDDFFERGGTTFDTAHIYLGGQAERVLGHWVKTRGVREQVVILAKGAHPPNCLPEAVMGELNESLDRLQTDYADIYMLHRDNPQVPVGEWVEVLHEAVQQGKIRAFGGSNWTSQRIDEANEYAKKRGLTPFVALSNNFSLARMVNPVWDGCLSSAELELKNWHTKTQFPLVAWSSQARGFFTDRSTPENTDDFQLVHCWYSEDNFARKQRAIELAKQKGVLPINIALAYVLWQPFPVFALIGPRNLEETQSSMATLNIELSEQELRWLNLEE